MGYEIKLEKYADQSQLILTIGKVPGISRSLFLFKESCFDEYCEDFLRFLPLTNKRARDFKRLSLDPQYGFYCQLPVVDGCITLPQRHLEWIKEGNPDGEEKVYDFHTYYKEKLDAEYESAPERLIILVEY